MRRALVPLLIAAAIGAGAWLLVGRDAGPAASSAPPSAAAGDSAPPAEPALAAPARDDHRLTVLTGRVLRGGAPVPGARVAARSSDGEPAEARTDDRGAFSFRGLVPGRYLLSATSEKDASPVFGPVLLGAGERREDVVLQLGASASVAGAVLDARTRRAVEGAVLRSSAGTARADHAGRFRIAPLPPGDTWLEASAPGYEQRTQWLTVASARDHAGLEILLRAAAPVRGRVTRSGQPVPGASVWAERSELAAGGERFGPVRADGEGRYELGVPAGSVQLAASAPVGPRVGGPRLTVAEGGAYDGVDIDLGEGATAVGVLVLDGQPGEDVALYLLDARTHQPAGSTWTGPGGAFRFEGLPVGPYLVQVQAPGVTAQRGPFTASAPEGPPWQVEVEGGAGLRGRVEPPRAGVIVRWRSAEWAGPYFAETTTDEKGAFSFRDVSSGAVTVEAEAGGAFARETARAGEEVVLRLAASAIAGYAVDERGAPVTDFVVRVAPADGGAPRLYPILDPRGDFRIAVPPGRYAVSARAGASGEAWAPGPVEVVAGRDTAQLKLAFGPTRRIAAQVVDAESGAPLGGAEVTVFGPRSAEAFSTPRLALLRTGPDGRFELGAVPARSGVRIALDGYRARWMRTDQLASAPDGKVALARGASRARQQQPYEGIGMFVRPGDAGVVVDGVFEGGPAQTAGVRRGDAVLAVDAVPVTSLGLDEVTSRIMGPSGTTVRLTLRRGEATFDVVVRRRSIQL